MKKYLLTAAGIMMVSAAILTGSRTHAATSAKGPDTLKVNSLESGKKFIGFNERTPVEIALVDGRIVYVKALPNQESPGYFSLVTESGLFERLNGLTVDEALATDLDAVSGATYSSEAVIGNIRAALLELK